MYKRVCSILFIVPLLAACQPEQVTPAAATPAPTVDATGTFRAGFSATANAIWTATAGAATSTPTAAPATGAGTPVDPPYLQSGGAIPAHALARIGIGQIYQARVYPDQKRVLLLTGSGLYAYRLPGFERIWRRYVDYPIQAIELSADGRFLSVNLGPDASPLLLNAETGERIAELQGGWFGATFSPDGRMAAVEQTTWRADIPYRFFLYDAATGQKLRTLETPETGIAGDHMGAPAWSPDSHYLAACSDISISVWNTLTGERIFTFADSTFAGGFDAYGCRVQFSPDPGYLIGKDNTHAFVINIGTIGQPVYEGAENVRNIIQSDYSNVLLIGDHKLEVLNTDTLNIIFTFDIPIWDASLSSPTQKIALASGSGITVKDTFYFETQYITSLPAEKVSWSPDGRWLIGEGIVSSYGEAPRLTLFDGKTGQIVRDPLDAGPGFAFVDDTQLLSWDASRVRLIDPASGKDISAARIGVDVKQLGWTAGGKTLILSGDDGDWEWNETSGQLERAQAGDPAAGRTIHIGEGDWRYPQYNSGDTTSPDGAWVLDIKNDVACGDGPFGGGCGIWGGKISLGRKGSAPILDMDLGGGGVTALAWTTDSALLAVGLGSGDPSLANDRVLLIDPAAGKVVLSLEGHLDQVLGLLFSPDGTRLASVSRDGTVIVWNVAARP